LAAERESSDGFGQLALARWCQEQGLLDDMWACLDRALAAPRSTPGLESFLAGLERETLPLKYRQLDPERKMKEILQRISDKNTAQDHALYAVLAHLTDCDEQLRKQGRSWFRSQGREAVVHAVAQKVAAAERGQSNATELGHDRLAKDRLAKDRGFLIYRTVTDGSERVREAATDHVKELGLVEPAVRRIGPLTSHENHNVKLRAIEALGEFGSPSGIEYLLTAYSGGGGSSPRGYVSFLDHQTYIKDFDVEVAQAAAIADPQVGVLTTGVVLDAQVKGVAWERLVVERRAIHSALRKIGGSDLPSDPSKWREHLAAKTDK
jgi:hypothetical protein